MKDLLRQYWSLISQKQKEPHERLWNKVINLEIMRKWWSKSNSESGLIVLNYNKIDHFNFYGISKRKLQENLNKTNIRDDNNRLLVFNASCKLLVTIRVASKKH